VVLVAPVLLLVILTQVRPDYLWGGLLALSETMPGSAARGVSRPVDSGYPL
jgi:hypothetical protein